MKKNKNYLTLAVCMAVMTGAVMTSCKKDDNVTPPDPIGGFNNSNEVGAANLQAHWTFDGTNNEDKSGVAPVASMGNSFMTGVKGQALMLDSGYLLYPATITNLNTANIGSMTVSCWINTTNNGSKATNAFSLTQGTTKQTDWNTGIVNMLVETGHPTATNDTLVLHPSFSTYVNGPTNRQGGDNINDYGVREVDFKTVHGTGRWVHYVMRYDASDTSGGNVDVFADGIIVSNTNFRHRGGIGAIVTTTPTQALVGAIANSAAGFTNSPVQAWQGMFRGGIDEIRFYNKALTDADISSLYKLEKAGR